KTPNQWREPTLDDADVARFRAGLAAAGIRAAVSHDSYLINLASPDDQLRARSARCFTGELERCRALGIPWVVCHPGTYMGDRRRVGPVRPHRRPRPAQVFALKRLQGRSRLPSGPPRVDRRG